jgi:glutathione S-transferase
MAITLHHCPETRSMRSLWLLNELGLPFTLNEMPFDHKFLRTREYLAVHPLGRIPALVDGDLTIFESGAICEYLCETYPSHDLWRPLGHPERPLWLQWVHFAETMLVHGQNLVQQWIFVSEAERSPVVINLESRRIGKCLDMLEDHLGRHDYILPSGFSAADTSLGFSVYFVTAFVSFDTHPAVQAYYDRLFARPAFRQSMPAGQTKPLEWLLPRLGPPMRFKPRPLARA